MEDYIFLGLFLLFVFLMCFYVLNPKWWIKLQEDYNKDKNENKTETNQSENKPMNKLEKKHLTAIENGVGMDYETGRCYGETAAITTTGITLEFAKGFAEWINTYYFQTIGESWGVKGTDGEQYSTQQLLEKYLKTL